jgi:hypothetical protein
MPLAGDVMKNVAFDFPELHIPTTTGAKPAGQNFVNFLPAISAKSLMLTARLRGLLAST